MIPMSFRGEVFQSVNRSFSSGIKHRTIWTLLCGEHVDFVWHVDFLWRDFDFFTSSPGQGGVSDYVVCVELVIDK